MAEYDSNEDSDVEPSTKGKGRLNMLLSTYGNLYNWYINSEAFTHITNHRDLFITISPYHKEFEKGLLRLQKYI